jgi:hypothetical protein
MRTFLAVFLWLFLSTQALSQTFINTVGSDDSVAIAGYDPVAFFTEKKAVPGSREFEYVYLGAT